MKDSLARIVFCIFFGLLSNTVYADPPMAPFYAAVMKMSPDGKLGQVIKKEKIKSAIQGTQAWKIAYISSDVAGRKTISTGLIVAPIGQAPKEGRPIMAWAHGTTGSAQNCGPSQIINPTAPLNEYFLMDGNSWTDYGIPNVEQFIKEGYVIVATDYQGLGGGGKHQYVVAGTNAMDTINSARAVGSMKEVGAGKKTIIYGWSQGGGAAIAAASLIDYQSLQGTAADNLQYLGFVGLAPDDLAAMLSKPADEVDANKILTGFSKVNAANIFSFSHYLMLIWGNEAAYPNIKMTDILTVEGARVADQLSSNKCVHVMADSLNYAYGDQYQTLLKPQPSNSMAWVNALIDGSVKPVKPVAPVVIYWGSKDTGIPPIMHENYQKKMCSLGGNVATIQLPGEQTHYTTPGSSAPFYLAWVKDRIAGKPLENGCPVN